MGKKPSRIIETEVPMLPGWTRKVTKRRGGIKNSLVRYVSPEGRQVKNKKQLRKMVGDIQPLGPLDFQTGEWNWPEVHDRICHEYDEEPQGRAIPPPLRGQVTVIRNHPESQTRHDLNYGPQEKPHQVLWWKGLAKIYPRDISEEIKNRPKKSFGESSIPDRKMDSSSDEASDSGFPSEPESNPGWELTSKNSRSSTSSTSTGGSGLQAGFANLAMAMSLLSRSRPQAGLANFGLAGFLQPPSQGQEEHQPGSEEKENQSQ